MFKNRRVTPCVNKTSICLRPSTIYTNATSNTNDGGGVEGVMAVGGVLLSICNTWISLTGYTVSLIFTKHCSKGSDAAPGQMFSQKFDIEELLLRPVNVPVNIVPHAATCVSRPRNQAERFIKIFYYIFF